MTAGLGTSSGPAVSNKGVKNEGVHRRIWKSFREDDSVNLLPQIAEWLEEEGFEVNLVPLPDGL